MVIALGFRLAIIAAPIVEAAAVKIVQWEQGPGLARLDERLQHELSTSPASDAALTAKVSAQLQRAALVTTVAGNFECRKLHWVFGRTSGGAVPEDDVMCTFHFLKLAAGVPVDAWVDADFNDVEIEFDAIWTALKHFYSDTFRVKQYRWYKAGPQVEDDLGGPGRTGEPVRVVDRNVVGTSAGVTGLPPQVACSVTWKTSSQKHWGRVYLPAPIAAEAGFNTVGHTGRWATPFTTAIADAFNASLDHFVQGNRPLVVYSRKKPARPTAAGGTLPAAPARAFTADELQIDDLPDVMRSRRFNAPLLRTLRTIG